MRRQFLVFLGRRATSLPYRQLLFIIFLLADLKMLAVIDENEFYYKTHSLIDRGWEIEGRRNATIQYILCNFNGTCKDLI